MSPKASKQSKRYQPLENLRNQLLKLEPAGPNGFEGLVATALSDLTGLTFRLAKSGSQFGRDASTPSGRFAIAMEAKRYKESLRLEDVAGKIWLASNELASDVDMWVLCATSEMGDGVLQKLEDMLEEKGITLLMLDWTEAPLPRLAALLAATQSSIIRWFTNYTSKEIAEAIDAELNTLKADNNFIPARNQLIRDASASYCGLAALRKINQDWINRVFSNRINSRTAFGQYLTILDERYPVISRCQLNTALSEAVNESSCVAILGPEGAGKSWLVANWWAACDDKPILVMGGSWMADRIDSRDPLLTLARLLAAQSEDGIIDSSDHWLRRLKRWREHGPVSNAEQLRFLVVLDGLNERSGMHWADTILLLKAEVEKLGGCLVTTCREGFWGREVAPRLAGVTIRIVRVGGYTPDELGDLLKQRGIAIDTIPGKVRDFILNPRICSIAIDFLENLSLQVDALTVERLLLEYWRRRLEERGDLTGHSLPDFEKLLRSHAKQFRNAQGVQFDRDNWREHSGAARRSDGRSLENDLSDIEEGAFLRIAPDRDGFYEFKPDIVPFALGLLIAQELQDELRKPNQEPRELIDRIVDEIRGFDLVGEALRAAAGIGCFKENYPAGGRAALISAWLELQNIDDSAYDALVAYVSACPEAVLDTVEIEFDERSNGSRRDWLVDALLQKGGNQNVHSAIDKRISRWLGRWSRVPQILGVSDEQTQSQQSEKAKPILDKLANLTPIEKEFLAAACFEVDSPEAAQLDSVAAKLMAGYSQAEYAEAVLAWAFTLAITSGYRYGDADLCWSVRLNTTDFEAFELKLRQAIDRLLTKSHSEVSKKAAAIALRLIGTVNGALEAEQLNPREYRKGWRAIENYCATDPYDPDSDRPENLENAINLANTLNPEILWTQFSVTQENHQLELITPALVRFQPDLIVHIVREVCKTLETRSELPLRQLSWNLPRFSPLFDEDTLKSVVTGYERIVVQPDLVDENDKTFVTGFILLSLLPHYSAHEQLALFLRLPAVVGEMYTFRDVFKALDETEIEMALIFAQFDPGKLRRTCFFISAHRPTLTNRSREILGLALTDNDPLVVTCASDVAFIAQDKFLDELVITAAKQRGTSKYTRETFHRDRAVTAAVVSLDLCEAISLIAPRFLGRAASKLNGELADRIEDEIEHAVNRLLKPVLANVPSLGTLNLDIDQTARDPMIHVEERVREFTGNADDSLQTFVNSCSLDKHSERLRLRDLEFRSYTEQLEMEGALCLIQEPDRIALTQLSRRNPNKTIALANRILEEVNPERLSAVRSFALALAESLADTNPTTTSDLFNHLSSVDSIVNINIGDAKIPQEAVTLFAGPDVEVLSKLRKKALVQAKTDAELQTLIYAAERSGHIDWLEHWIANEVATEIPGRIARGLMVEGLRNFGSVTSPFLSRDWGPGFLGEVAKQARFSHERNIWSRTWATKALQANNSLDFWRWGELTVGIVDIRAFHWFDLNVDNPLVKQFGKELFGRIRSESEKRTKKREETLFGIKK
uniref:hypothetical protein n=1 Tax=Methylotuvimicrobium buryatense TaxID=95641 RepID=UPI00038232BA